MINRESENQITPEIKIYKYSALWIGAFFGGPLAAGYIIAENFKALNNPGYAKKTWIFTVLATIIFIIGTLLMPKDIKIPTIFFPFICTDRKSVV